MVEIYNKYQDKGLEILAFPCNQFKEQEPGTHEEIKAFAAGYGAEFKFFAKCDVNGENTHEVYQFLRRHSELYDEETQTVGEIPWNFAKFLINPEGHVVRYNDQKISPEEMLPTIEEMLGV